MNLYPVTVVENFLDNPDSVRTFALNQKYHYRQDLKEAQYVFPGARTLEISVINKSYYESISRKIISLFHNEENDRMRWLISTNFQSVTDEYGRGVIHTDSNTVFAAVLYLSPDAPLNAGTSLFKPNKEFDNEKYEWYLKENDKRFAEGKVVMDTSYHNMFDEIVRINNVYNTLILYEGRHYHAANDFFGKCLNDSRLTQVFFVSKIDAQKYSSFPIWRAKQVKI